MSRQRNRQVSAKPIVPPRRDNGLLYIYTREADSHRRQKAVIGNRVRARRAALTRRERERAPTSSRLRRFVVPRVAFIYYRTGFDAMAIYSPGF